jgi:hypothetical protein
MSTNGGFSSGLAIGLLVLVIVVLILLATVPVGGQPDSRPIIDIRF